MVSRLEEESSKLSALVAHDRFELSEESTMLKKLDAAGQESEISLQENSFPYKVV